MRARGGLLIARPITTPGQIIRTVEGHLVQGQAGDWTLMTPSGAVLRVVGAQTLDDGYETVEEGGCQLSGRTVRLLEDRLGPGTASSEEKLVAAVERLARIGVGEIELPFTPGQLEEMQRRAKRNNRSLTEEFRFVLARIADDIFYGTGGRTTA